MRNQGRPAETTILNAVLMIIRTAVGPINHAGPLITANRTSILDTRKLTRYNIPISHSTQRMMRIDLVIARREHRQDFPRDIPSGAVYR